MKILILFRELPMPINLIENVFHSLKCSRNSISNTYNSYHKYNLKDAMRLVWRWSEAAARRYAYIRHV